MIPKTLHTRLEELVRQRKSPDAIERALQQLVDETGVSGAELRVAFDGAFAALQADKWVDASTLSAWKSAVAEFAFSQTHPTLKSGVAGRRAHQLQGSQVEKQNPWWTAVEKGIDAPLGPVLYAEPRRDVTIDGVKLSKDELTDVLRSIGKGR